MVYFDNCQERHTDIVLHFVCLASSFARKLSVYSELENMYDDNLHCKRQGAVIVSYKPMSDKNVYKTYPSSEESNSLCLLYMLFPFLLRSTKFPGTQ